MELGWMWKGGSLIENLDDQRFQLLLAAGTDAALPQTMNRPSETAKFSPVRGIALTIPKQFRYPVSTIGLRHPAIGTIVPVPKASIHLDD
jgi:hypothetical protein